jgi:hypothetical protein
MSLSMRKYEAGGRVIKGENKKYKDTNAFISLRFGSRQLDILKLLDTQFVGMFTVGTPATEESEQGCCVVSLNLSKRNKATKIGRDFP